MSRNKFIAVVSLFILINLFANVAFAAKSVFVINAQDDSGVKVYKINGNQVELQATTYLPREGAGAIALAAWLQKELMFITYDLSPRLDWASTKTLIKLGEYTEPNVSPYGNGLAGIVIDTTR